MNSLRWLVAGMALLHAADFVSTVLGVSRGLYEANPLLAPLTRSGWGLALFACLKAFVVYRLVRDCWDAEGKAARVYTVLLVMMTGAYLAVIYGNLTGRR